MNRRLTTLILLLLAAASLWAQAQRIDPETLKKTALSHMESGRYGDAIDQLNKYISANPQNPEGYNLRGICFENRQQYFNGRLDFRRAIALETRDARKRSEYEQNLARLISIWYPILEKRIEGHLREIAINPSNPFNYLEIGKSYMWMEIWEKAELWYDEYLARDDNAVPDEIIRYTEILSHTGSIVKGERILKKYVERYPDDWRLWSRYGYFTMWLSKYAIAKKAFETALSIKPFFKEAMDGLDLVTNQAYVQQQSPRAFEREFPIDRYYRLLRRNPADIETRLKLVEELIANDRIEEAYQQLQIIGITKAEDLRYQEKWTYVTEFRAKTYRERLDSAKVTLQINPTDKAAVRLVAEYYEYLQEYDSAMVVLDKYFESFPEERDEQLRARYSKMAAWNREFDKSIAISDSLIVDFPNNLDYQLFRAQVSVWINRDTSLARQYLENVLRKRPNDLSALISISSLKLLERDYVGAQSYADKAKEIDPINDDVIKLQSDIDWQRLRAEEEKLYAILEDGRRRVLDEDCPDALLYYEDYLAKAEPNVLILKEYGDVLFCAKEYEQAIGTYNEVLAQGYNYDAAMQRAKVYYAIEDTLASIREFKALAKEDSTDFEAQLYLGDSYARAAIHDSARAIYNMLLDDWELDSTQVRLVELRKGFLPVTGLRAIFENLPSFLAAAPTAQFFSDNAGFNLFTAGSRLNAGITNYFTLGVSFIRTRLKATENILDPDIISTYNYSGNISFNTFKVHGTLNLARDLIMGFGLGQSSARGNIFRDEKDAFIRFERKDTISLSLTYQASDAVLILYSPYLIDNRDEAKLFRLDGSYRHRNGVKVSGYFQYVIVGNNNEGNDLNLRLGKYFYKDLAIGYEYNYTNYKFKSSLYYSPNNFESHCIWIDNELERRKDLSVTLGGKIGITLHTKILVLGAYLDVKHQMSNNLLLSGQISASSTSREESSYRSFSAVFSIYWTFY
jgi:predicted Zn-dependent protease